MSLLPTKTFLLLFFAVLLLSASITTKRSLAQEADLILTNGKILTVDQDFSIADSLAVRDGKIIAVGAAKVINQHKTERTTIIDLHQKTVIPGLIDNHFHFIRSVWNFQSEVRIDGITSKKEALRLMAKKAKETSSDKWITVMGGWTPAQFRDGSQGFSLEELNQAVPNNPLYIQQSYRAAFINSKAKAISKTRDARGALLKGRKAMGKFKRFVGGRNKRASKEAVLNYMTALNSYGLTTVYDIGRPSEGDLQSVSELAKSGPLPLRVFHSLRYRAQDERSTQDALRLMKDKNNQPLSMDDQYGLIGVGEHIYGPMHDRPNQRQPWPNDVWDPVRRLATAAAQNGWPVHEHTMSEVTISQFLDLIEEISIQTPEIKSQRWTLAHALGINEKDIQRAKLLGVAIAAHSQAMMNTRSHNSPPLGSLERSGVLWGLGSDGAIVAPINPFMTLGWAVTGKDISGQESWSQDQRVSREAALRAHTINNAKMLFKSDKLGSLEVGKLADFVVLDQDYMAISADKISTIKPLKTFTNGKIKFER